MALPINLDLEILSLRSAEIRAYDDGAQCWNVGIGYKRAYALSSYALTFAALTPRNLDSEVLNRSRTK